MSNTNYNQDITKIYNTIKSDISEILENISNVDINQEEDNAFLEGLRLEMEEFKTLFEKDIDFLEKNSEWEKFTIALFGETNAGKSTIIESLKIIFDEVERRKKINDNKDKVSLIESDFLKNAEHLKELLSNLNKTIEDQDMKSIDEISILKKQLKKFTIISILSSSILSIGGTILVLKFVFNLF